MGEDIVINERSLSRKPDVVNFLRVAATMFVFLLHGRSYVAGIKGAYNNPVSFLTYFPAWAGVWIFLFLSAYTIGVGFFAERYKMYNEKGRISVKSFLLFYWGRFVRLAPLYYAYCIIFELLSGNFFFMENGEILLRMLTFTFNGNGGISGIGHLWYVSLAMQLYLFMPFVYLLLKLIKNPKALTAVFFAGAVAGLIVRIIYMNSKCKWYDDVYTNVFANLDCLVCGMAVAAIRKQKKRDISKYIPVKITAAVFFIALVLYNNYIYHDQSKESFEIYRYILPTFYILTCTFLIFAFEETCDRKDRVSLKDCLKRPLRFINWLSPYTYAFYILHIPVLKYVQKLLDGFSLYMKCELRYRYVIFFGLGFIVNTALSVAFTKAAGALTKRKK